MWMSGYICTSRGSLFSREPPPPGKLIDSTPPAPASTMERDAMAIDCRPDEQKRLMVTPEVVIGRPDSSAAVRPRLPAPCATLPMKQSSTASFSTFALSTACFTAWAAIVTVGVMLNPPRADLARPVRAYETTTASRINLSSPKDHGLNFRLP